MSEYRWRDQPITVRGRQFSLGDVNGSRLYHGSTHRLAPGDIVRPGMAGRNHEQSPDDTVSVTSLAWNARRWVIAAGATEVHVYEVEPLSWVEAHRTAPADYGTSFQVYEARTPLARVIREIPVTRPGQPEDQED